MELRRYLHLIRQRTFLIVLTLLWLLIVLTVPLSSWDRRSAPAAVGAPTATAVTA